ncbi:GNAT family N-acetyltransferase [Yoonia sp. F2084L]|uniref:GNAT family N-acetyltransferase n=1 Tax=Yoonia sp. F2084L TaxID=2926419 RepID=UPI001FF6A0BF|nr:GNAT family N-acetyltransferase [Yoonia sp. F2084L]
MKPAPSLPLQQHPYFAAALTRLGRTVRFMPVDGAAPVLSVRQFGQWITSRGPVWQGGRNADALRCTGLRFINADIPDDALLRAAGYRRLMTNAHVAELDLSGTREDRQKAMQPKWRNAWRVGQKARVTLKDERYCATTHEWLLKADLAQQRAKRFRGLPHALIGAYAATSPKSVRVLTAHDGKDPIAGMLFLLHSPVATYHIGWTNARGRVLCAHHHMIVDAADRLAQLGFTRLDLGLVDTESAPGLARFKIGTGADVRPLGGTWLRLSGR